MPVSGQIGAIQPVGMKKKKMRFAPMVQEQARQGIATQMVVGQKQEEARQEEKAFQQEQLGIQKGQLEQENKQWQEQFALRQRENEQAQTRWKAEQAQYEASQQAQRQQWQSEMEARKKQQTQNMILGGAGIAADIMGLFW